MPSEQGLNNGLQSQLRGPYPPSGLGANDLQPIDMELLDRRPPNTRGWEMQNAFPAHNPADGSEELQVATCLACNCLTGELYQCLTDSSGFIL